MMDCEVYRGDFSRISILGESTSNDDDNVARTPNIIIKDLGRRKSNEGLGRVASTYLDL